MGLGGYQLNHRVKIHITREIPGGLLGTLLDGARAFIPNREIAWEHPKGLKGHLVGKTRDAVVVGFDPDRAQLELSLRYAVRNPWETAALEYVVGQEVEGIISGLSQRAAFVTLTSGIEAMLPLSELPIAPDQRIEDWLWPDDEVKASVLRVEPERHRLRLSLVRLLQRRQAEYRRRLWMSLIPQQDSGVTIAELLPQDVRLGLLQLAQDTILPAPGLDLRAVIIDDDETYGAGLQSLLVRNGYHARLLPNAISGLSWLAEAPDPLHLILLDWNLPGPKGHEVLARFQDMAGDARLVVMLEPEQLRGREDVWDALIESTADIVYKSETSGQASALVSILADIRASRTQPKLPNLRRVPDATGGGLPVAGLGAQESEAPMGLQTEAHAEQVLKRLLGDTGASTALLLQYETGQSKPRLTALAGAAFPISTAPPEIMYSPLSDVLVDGLTVCALLNSAPKRFERLRALGPFTGFMGVPLPPCQGSRYGLVLLRQEGGFSEGQLEVARLATYVLAGILQSERLLAALVPWQQQHMTGQLVASVIHELTNSLGGLSNQIDTLAASVEALLHRPEQANHPSFLATLVQQSERVEAAMNEANEISGRYFGLISSSEEQLIDPLVPLRSAIAAIRPNAQKGNISVALCAPDRVPWVQAQRGQLLQVCLNLLLNAMQQMTTLKREGTISVTVTHRDLPDRAIEIRVSDEGPGIHKALWERIFDFGFTMRHEGAGLGLTVSRKIASQLGGSLRVEESFLLWGTTFLLQLPSGE
jgi:signal transduction histidine kinase/predicted RNA-binding protein with RPS1 domain/CheY-like chemotaxis protein